MKIFSVDQIFKIEQATQEFLNVSLSFLMEKAGDAIVNFILRALEEKKIPQGNFLFIIGKGNNGGDGFFSASKLLSLGFCVEVLALHADKDSSFLNTKYRNAFSMLGGKIWEASDIKNLNFSSYQVIVDAILGIGFKIEKSCDQYKAVIQKINNAFSFVISIDTPSGLDIDKGLFSENLIVKAKMTLGLGFPKLGYFLDESKDFIGQWHVLSLPIPHKIINNFETKYFLLHNKDISKELPQHSLSAHKYDKGMVVGFGGQKGMKGALSLACLGALHSGAGIVVGVSPLGSGFSYDSLPYEVIKIESSFKKEDDLWCEEYLKKAKSIFLGPGLGKNLDFPLFIERVINRYNLPMVFDADALNLYSVKPFALSKQCIFTPHLGEMKRILKIQGHILLEELIQRVQSFANEKNIVIVLKGASTFIFSNNKIFISSQGNISLATAGSGDILTGVIASLLAQGLDCEKAACLGVTIQGLAAQKASQGIRNCFFKSGDFLPYVSAILQENQEKDLY